MNDVAAFITAGGRSTRMGRDKAWLELGGQSLIERVISALKPITANLAIIANSGDYAGLGLPVFSDEQPGIGPLEAIRTALANSRTRRVILIGCDLPFVTSELFALLLSISADYHAVVPVGSDGRLEPLCSVYSTECEPIVRSLIESGERKVSALFDRVPTRLVQFDELRHLEGSERFFENINTPEDYRRAQRLVSRP